jgi:hypothetical protein
MLRLSYFLFLATSSATETEEGEATAAANAGERNWIANENFMVISSDGYVVVLSTTNKVLLWWK